MGRKKSSSESRGSAVYENGKLIIKEEDAEYYARLYAWKRAFPLQLSSAELDWLQDYEMKNGRVTQWVDADGNLRDLRA